MLRLVLTIRRARSFHHIPGDYETAFPPEPERTKTTADALPDQLAGRPAPCAKPAAPTSRPRPARPGQPTNAGILTRRTIRRTKADVISPP